MKTISVNTKLYFLLTYADGEIHEKEREMGEKMLFQQSQSKEAFEAQIKELEKFGREEIFEDCMRELSTFHRNDQINCLAWMCLIANADGFMDKNEWELIYRIYHKRLELPLSEITARQKELHKFILQYRNIPEASAKPLQKPEYYKPALNKPSPSKDEDQDQDKPKLSFPM